MADSHPSPSPVPPDKSPFNPFGLEPQKAHNSTGSGGPPPTQPVSPRRFRIPPAFLGLLLAVAVAVPTVLATLPPAGQAPSDGGAAPAVQGDAPPDTGSPPTTSGDPANPGRQLQAVEDCAEGMPDLRASCATLLGEDAHAAALYLNCRGTGLPAKNCLAALPPK